MSDKLKTVRATVEVRVEPTYYAKVKCPYCNNKWSEELYDFEDDGEQTFKVMCKCRKEFYVSAKNKK